MTAIAGDPQKNIDFYSGLLGLRLVKRTVNFDDPRTYHFYYGDETGRPGSLMTFFPWPGARRGQQGAGQVAIASFATLPIALGFWVERLLSHGIVYTGPTRAGSGADAEQVLEFKDPDGLIVQIVAHAGAEGRPAWSGAPGIRRDHALRGLHRVTLWVGSADATERVLVDTLGFRAAREDESVRRYAVGEGGPGEQVDVRSVGGFVGSTEGVGTIHHVAWSVADDAAQVAVRERVVAAALDPTPVIDRRYFHSVYFREPGGVLFELATSGPGFTVDEPLSQLGERLMLPSSFESQREAIEAALPSFHLGAGNERRP